MLVKVQKGQVNFFPKCLKTTSIWQWDSRPILVVLQNPPIAIRHYKVFAYVLENFQ